MRVYFGEPLVTLLTVRPLVKEPAMSWDGSGARASPQLARGAELRDEAPAPRRPSSADPNLGYAAGPRVRRIRRDPNAS